MQPPMTGNYVGDGAVVARTITTGLSGVLKSLTIFRDAGPLLLKTPDIAVNAVFASSLPGVVGNGTLFQGPDFSVVDDLSPYSANALGAGYFWIACAE